MYSTGFTCEVGEMNNHHTTQKCNPKHPNFIHNSLNLVVFIFQIISQEKLFRLEQKSQPKLINLIIIMFAHLNHGKNH